LEKEEYNNPKKKWGKKLSFKRVTKRFPVLLFSRPQQLKLGILSK
jgi:hypothetical protein